MRTTSSTAILLVSVLTLGLGCTTSTSTPNDKPVGQTEGNGGNEPGTAGDDTTNAPPESETAAACADAPAGTVVDVTVSDLKALIDSGSKIAVIDVREPDETAQGTIDGALLYPWTSKVLHARHSELPTDRPIYVICRSGSRSSAASPFLAKNGHACIHNVEGGMNAWLAAKYPVVNQ